MRPIAALLACKDRAWRHCRAARALVAEASRFLRWAAERQAQQSAAAPDLKSDPRNTPASVSNWIIETVALTG